jgi:hypothetical protein
MTAAKAATSKSGYVRPSVLAKTPIPDHDDMPVTQSNATITGLQGGFSAAARVQPIHYPSKCRAIGLVVMTNESHEYDRVTEKVKGGPDVVLDEFLETTVWKGETLLIIDPDDVEGMVSEFLKLLAKARSEADAAARAKAGEFQLDGLGDDEQDGKGKKLPEGATAAKDAGFADTGGPDAA